MQTQVMANGGVEHRAQTAGLVLLADDGVVQGQPGGAGGAPVHGHHFLQDFALAGGVEQQHRPHPQGAAELAQLLAQAGVALAHADGVDHHPGAVRQ